MTTIKKKYTVHFKQRNMGLYLDTNRWYTFITVVVVDRDGYCQWRAYILFLKLSINVYIICFNQMCQLCQSHDCHFILEKYFNYFWIFSNFQNLVHLAYKYCRTFIKILLVFMKLSNASKQTHTHTFTTSQASGTWSIVQPTSSLCCRFVLNSLINIFSSVAINFNNKYNVMEDIVRFSFSFITL